MKLLEIRDKANSEIELMEGCMPAINNLPEDKIELQKELKKLAQILHESGKVLNYYAKLLNHCSN